MPQKNLLLLLNINYGSARPMSSSSSPDFYKIINSINEKIEIFDEIFVANDFHTNSSLEFKSLPPHCVIGSGDTTSMAYMLKRKATEVKKTEQAATSQHLAGLMRSHDDYILHIGGFNCCWDVVPTALSIKVPQKITTPRNLIGDVSEDYKKTGLSYLDKIGIDTREI